MPATTTIETVLAALDDQPDRTTARETEHTCYMWPSGGIASPLVGPSWGIRYDTRTAVSPSLRAAGSPRPTRNGAHGRLILA